MEEIHLSQWSSFWGVLQNKPYPNITSFVLLDTKTYKSKSLVSKEGFVCFPTFSKDDMKLAYYDMILSSPPGEYKLMMIELDSENPISIQLTTSMRTLSLYGGVSYNPKFSPDSNKILFEGGYDLDNVDLKMRGSLTSIIDLRDKKIRKTYNGFFDKEGKRLLAYWKHYDKESQKNIYEYKIIDADDPHNCVENLDQYIPQESVIINWDPTNRYILYEKDENLYIFDRETQNNTDLLISHTRGAIYRWSDQ